MWVVACVLAWVIVLVVRPGLRGCLCWGLSRRLRGWLREWLRRCLSWWLSRGCVGDCAGSLDSG